MRRAINAAKDRKPAVRRVYSPAEHRAAKLGDATIEKLRGTSLARAREQDDLVLLNRGAAEGEHTAIVRQLVADAIAGKNVSATAIMNNGAPLPHDDADDIGTNNAEEIARKDDELEELRAAKRLAEIQTVGLRSQVEELCSLDDGGLGALLRAWDRASGDARRTFVARVGLMPAAGPPTA